MLPRITMFTNIVYSHSFATNDRMHCLSRKHKTWNLKKKKEKKKHIMLEHAGAIKHSMGLSMPDWLFCFFVLRNGQKQSKNKKNYHYTILSKGKHWRGVHQEHYQEPHQEPHQEKAGGTMKTASTWQKWPRTYYMSISN